MLQIKIEDNRFSKEVYVDDGKGITKHYKSDSMEYLETVVGDFKLKEDIRSLDIRYYVNGEYNDKKEMTYANVKDYKVKIKFLENLEKHLKEKH